MGASQFRRRLGDLFRRFLRDRRGNVSPIMALMLVPIIGSFGFAAEASRWFVAQRGAQNAADAAVIAAVRNGCAVTDSCHVDDKLPTYDSEAKSVAKEFGFTHDGADVNITTSNAWPCPGGGNTCYSVLLTLKSPIYLVRITGFNGDATAASGQPAQFIQALAVAQRQPGHSFCITAYGDTDDAIEFNGAPSLDLQGCDFFTPNGGASCNAHSGDTVRYAYVSDSGNTNDNCGSERVTSETSDDAYAALNSSIPADTCTGADPYPQRVKNGPSKDEVTTVANQLNGDTAGGTAQHCGDVRLYSNTTYTSDTVLVIYNGRLDLNGYRLGVASGAHLTIVFSGSNDSTYDHTIVSTSNGSVIDFTAPNSGAWSGVAIYQDPDLTTNVDMTVSGNDPEFNITGLIYAPEAVITLSGAINHATAGDACLAFVVDTLTVSGDGSIFAYPTRECDRAGLTELDKVWDRVVLVQ